MLTFFLKYKLIFFIILSGFLIALFFILKPKATPPTPTIISSSYQSLTPTKPEAIIFTFDQLVLADNLQLTSYPSETWDLKNTSFTQIIATPTIPLASNTSYNMIFYWNQKPLKPYTFNTPKFNVDYRQNYLLQQKMDLKYPLGKQTPYETDSLRVVYLAPKVLEITLKNKTLSSNQAINQVKSWVNSQGVDPTSHQYKVVFPQ